MFFRSKLMVQKSYFPKVAGRRIKPGKQGIFLTVRANYDFEHSSQRKVQPPHCNPLVLCRLALALLYALAPQDGARVSGWARGRTAQGVRHTRRGGARVRTLARPEAVEGVAVVCDCCSSVAAVDA